MSQIFELQLLVSVLFPPLLLYSVFVRTLTRGLIDITGVSTDVRTISTIY
jgi:hypothetical protein